MSRIIAWFYAREGRQHGPIADAELREMAANGQLHSTDLLWREGMANWEYAARMPQLFPPGRVPPPLPVSYATPAPPAIGETAGMRWLLPVGRSGWAIAAGYLGLFSVLVFPAPFALICAIIAIIEMRRHPNRHGMGRAVFGLIMGLLFSAALLLILIARLVAPY